jgi:hypothetical protein
MGPGALHATGARGAVACEAAEKAEPAEITAADDWIAQQRHKIAGAGKILSLITDPIEHRDQVRHIAALKAHLSRQLLCP